MNKPILSILIPTVVGREEQRTCKVCKAALSISNFTHHFVNGKKYYEHKCKDCRSRSRRQPTKNKFILQDGELLADWIGYEGRYMVSNFGRISSLRHASIHGSRERDEPVVLSTPLNGNGYPSVMIRVEGDLFKPYRVHRLVAEHFIPNPNNLPCINHKDGDKTNNRVDNLEWCTFRHNLLHARRTGLNPSLWGEGREKSSLKNKDVLIILNSNISAKELSKKYNVSISAIYDIRNGKSWNHITNLPLTRKKKI